MNLLKLSVLILLCPILLNCAATSKTGISRALTSPVDDTRCLVCGSIIVENNWRWVPQPYRRDRPQTPADFGKIQESYKKDIDVVVLGKFKDEEGAEKIDLFYTKTDESGYFFIENVPPGDYALSGFQIYMVNGTNHGVSSSLYGPEAPYLKIGDAHQPLNVKRAAHFPFSVKNRIINLRHNVFFMTNTQMVGHQAFEEINNLSFNFSNLRYTMEPVEDYLISRFPDSGWVENLKAGKRKTNIVSPR